MPSTSDENNAQVMAECLTEAWHEGAGEAFGLSLHQYLGMTWEQYARYAQDSTLPAGWPPPPAIARPPQQQGENDEHKG